MNYDIFFKRAINSMGFKRKITGINEINEINEIKGINEINRYDKNM